MAFTQLYDQYAPMLGTGVETEEERRKRLEEEAAVATPVTQTIKTNPVTGEQEMTIKGTPQDLSAANPLTPTVTPVTPEQVSQQLAPTPSEVPSAPVAPVQAAPEVKPPTIEELAQQYKLNQMPQAGEGVQVAGPVVPGAMKIPPAEQAQRDQQGRLPILQNELANATARLQTATDPAEQQRLQGDIAALQREIGSTRGGVQRVAAPVAPGQAPAAAPAPAAQAPAMTPEQVQRETQMRDFQEASKNPDAMIQYMARKDVPEDLKTAMKLNHYETLLADDRKAKAEQRVVNTITNNPQALPKIINDKSEEGSIAKAFLYSLIGFKSGADAEVAKMNLPKEWRAVEADGKTGTVLFSTNGLPLQGVNSDGTKMSPQELTTFASAGSTKYTKPDVSMQDVEKGGMKGRVVTTYDRQNRPTTVVESGGKTYTYDSSWKPVSISTAAEKAETSAAVKLRYAGPTAYTAAGAKFAGEFNAANGTNIGYQTQRPGAPLVDLNTGKPVSVSPSGVINVTQTGTPGEAAPAPAAAPAARPAPAAAAPSARASELPPQPRFQEPGFEGESPVAFADRTKAWSTTYGKQYEQQAKNTKEAKQLLPFINEMKQLVDKSTGSGIGSIVDQAGNFIGYSTPGAEAIAAIAPLASKVLMGVQRFEGPQSDKDVAAYKEAAGKLSDPNIPAKQKQAAFNTIIEIMKRNAPELDWSSVAGPASATQPYKDPDKEKRYQEWKRKNGYGG